MTQRRESLPPIQFGALAAALLPMAETLLPKWLSGGRRERHEWVCGSLAGEAGSSCSVNVNKGAWKDFATGEEGRDLLSLYAAIHGLSMAKAAVQVAREEGLESVAGLVKTAAGGAVVPAANPRPVPAPKPTPEKEGWATMHPVPGWAPAPTFSHHYRQPQDLMHTGEYRVGDDLHGYVARFRTSDGGKDTLPYTFCQSSKDGASKWHWKQWDEPRPLFFPNFALPNGLTVILVEGEVKAEVLQQLLDTHSPGVYCVCSWPGGSNAWQKADWSWLAGSTVLLWPDCDAMREKLTKAELAEVGADVAAKEALQATKPLLPEAKQPGMKAQLGIGAILRDAHGCTVSLLPIPKPGEKPSGWDCKDAIADEGWTFDDVLALFGRAQPLLAVQAAEPAAETAAPGKKSRSLVGTKGRGTSGFTPGGACDSVEDDDMLLCGGYKVPRWMSYFWDAEKSRWNITRKAVIACLEKDPALKGIVAFNELSNSLATRRAWPWRHAKVGAMTNADELLLGKWLSDTYGLPSVSAAALEEGIKTVGYTERYHPIREWLIGLEHDGKPRLDNWLVHALGESPESLNPALLEYLQLVGRFWVLGMVYRVMEPGCKFDYCPVLEGKGGRRKSTLVEVLASTDFYSDTKFDVSRGHEAQEQVQGVWLYEIAELAGFSKADVNDIKSFITSKKDRYRVAYGKVVEDFPRQCVMVGTTNDDKYLRDPTGNRRFWPVPVKHVIKTEWVQKYRAQLFAEAFSRYSQGERYTPTGDEEDRLFVPMQGSRLIETAVETRLMVLMTRDAVGAGDSGIHVDTKFVTIDKVVTALGIDVAKSSAGLENQIRGWFKQHEWTHGKKQVAGVRLPGYYRPDVWPPVNVVVGLDQPDRDGNASDAPSSQAPAGTGAPLTPAARHLQDMADDEPF